MLEKLENLSLSSPTIVGETGDGKGGVGGPRSFINVR